MSIFNQLQELRSRIGGGVSSFIQGSQEDDSWIGRAKRFTQKGPTDYISDYFKPTSKIRARDVIRGLPQAQADIVKNLALELPTRATMKFQMELKRLQGKKEIFTPETKLEKFILGREPVTSFSRTGEKFEKTKIGQYIKKKTGIGKFGMAITSIGMTGLDVLPWGGAS